MGQPQHNETPGGDSAIANMPQDRSLKAVSISSDTLMSVNKMRESVLSMMWLQNGALVNRCPSVHMGKPNKTKDKSI